MELFLQGLQTIILPVFAGMIPRALDHYPSTSHSPRIRGDDPYIFSNLDIIGLFSPYSRG